MITLYEHNQKAYNEVRSFLNLYRKAAVIHPTGTGKSFIAFKLAEDHPEALFVWVSPSESIYRTQLENIKKAFGFEPENINFLTYAKLMNMTKSEIESLNPSYIILDEFHRAGADEWGRGVQTLLSSHSDAYLLGLTATNIRYLDRQRDMAEELFGNNIASSMSLGESIARGILSTPKYVLTGFQLEADLKKYQQRVKNAKNAAVRGESEKLLESLRRALEQAEGLDVIFQKHITNTTGKYLVFCSNLKHMNEMIAHVPEWFGNIDVLPHVYSVYADDPETSRAFQAFKKDDDQEHIKLLFCIDMLNEGIHVEDISGVILFRPTVSPIIYKQQIGRALSASKSTEPVIIDVVNNIENLYSIGSVSQEFRDALVEMRYRGDEADIVNEQFRVIDEIQDCRELFARLDETLSASWELMYSHAVDYYKQHGNLDIVFNYKTADGYSLGAWIQTQRSIRAGTMLGKLDEERIQKLDAIGMHWGPAYDYRWERNYQACVQYKEKNGNLNIPTQYITEDGIALGSWISRLRCYHRDKKYNSYYTRERDKRMDELGMLWDIKSDIWEQSYTEAEAFFREHGDLNVPKGYIQNGVKLYGWLAEQRQIRRGNRKGQSLTADQIQRLDLIQMQWKSGVEASWEKGLAEAKQYYTQHGDLDVPRSYVSPSGYKLWGWLCRCRAKYQSGKMPTAQIAELEKLNIIWSHKNDWDDCFGYLKEYHDLHGNLFMPKDYVVDGVWLYKWLNEQKQILLGKRAGKTLSPEQKKKLSSIGFSTECTNDQRWAEQYEAVKKYFDAHGNIQMPANYTDESGRKLYKWLSNQRASNKVGKLAPERRSLLQKIGFI